MSQLPITGGHWVIAMLAMPYRGFIRKAKGDRVLSYSIIVVPNLP